MRELQFRCRNRTGPISSSCGPQNYEADFARRVPNFLSMRWYTRASIRFELSNAQHSHDNLDQLAGVAIFRLFTHQRLDEEWIADRRRES